MKEHKLEHSILKVHFKKHCATSGTKQNCKYNKYMLGKRANQGHTEAVKEVWKIVSHSSHPKLMPLDEPESSSL